jgi:acetyl esterase/lipase
MMKLPLFLIMACCGPAIALAAAEVVMERDVPYLAPHRSEKLDLYLPPNRDGNVRSPAVVIIHGGGWVGGNRAAKREQVTGTTLAKAGYVCVSVSYWLKERDRWPTNLHDCKNAVRWLRVNHERLQIDPERIGVIGGSAGGHLALMVAYTAGDARLEPQEPYPGVPDHVSACVNMYGVSNLLTRRRTHPDGEPAMELKGHHLFPESREEAPEKWRLASPVSHVRRDSPPTLTLHGTADTVVDRDQAHELHRALRAAGADSTLRFVDGATHAWALRTKDFDLRGEVVAFFDRHLKR